MRKALLSLLVIYVGSISCFGQVSFTGSAGSVSTGDDAATVVVDDALVITNINDYTIDGARVVIATNFTLGDSLKYTETLPTDVNGHYDASTGILSFTGIASTSDYQSILRSVTFTAFASGGSNRVIEFYLGSKDFYKANNHYYEYVPSSSISWATARDNAATRSYFGLQGYLATITSSAENQFIQQNLTADGWIGATDDIIEVNKANPEVPITEQWNTEANYYWVTGPEKGIQFSKNGSNPVPVNGQYFNWNDKEPNGWVNVNYVKFISNGGWDDMPLEGESWERVNGYFVEYGGLTGEQTIDLIHSRMIEVKSTTLTTTASKNYFAKNSLVIADPALELKSGGMIANAEVTISDNFASGDVLSFNPAMLPTGITYSYNSVTGVLSFSGKAKPSAWQALFRTVSFQSTSNSSNDRTVSFSIGNIVRGSNGHFYEYVKDVTYTWKEAYAAAADRSYMGLQGYLATITSKEENDLIDQKLRADGWLGGSDDYAVVNAAAGTTYPDQDASEGNFYWVAGPEKGMLISTGNGSPVPSSLNPYMHWFPGEPNNAGPEHYLEIYSTLSGASGFWNDLPNNSSLGMVVEYGGLPTDPGSVLLSASRVITNVQVLPVLGLKFQVKEKGSSVELNWSVLQEQNVKCYEILYSINGSSFRKIGTIEAKGNADHALYSYTDKNAVNGINYYKIVVVDEDGKKHYSDVGSTTIRGKLQLYPSVITDHFTVHQPNPLPGLLILTDVSGTKLLVKNINQGVYNLEVGFLPRGAYFVQVYYGDKERHVFKIIKH